MLPIMKLLQKFGKLNVVLRDPETDRLYMIRNVYYDDPNLLSAVESETGFQIHGAKKIDLLIDEGILEVLISLKKIIDPQARGVSWVYPKTSFMEKINLHMRTFQEIINGFHKYTTFRRTQKGEITS